MSFRIWPTTGNHWWHVGMLPSGLFLPPWVPPTSCEVVKLWQGTQLCWASRFPLWHHSLTSRIANIRLASGWQDPIYNCLRLCLLTEYNSSTWSFKKKYCVCASVHHECIKQKAGWYGVHWIQVASANSSLKLANPKSRKMTEKWLNDQFIIANKNRCH